jgi:hypothetical protein
MVMTAGVLPGCRSPEKAESEAACTLRKPGTIVSVNEWCPMVPVDPVDPTVVVEYKGQKVSFCCEGCRPKWGKLTDAERDVALAKAVAKGKAPVAADDVSK